MSSPNPFGGPNPFADPAVTVHTESAANDTDSGGYGVVPATTGAWGSNPSPWGSSAAAPTNGRKPTQTERELSIREEEIKKREKQLEEQQRELQSHNRTAERDAPRPVKNWPPCFPILYHDIEAEVTFSLQSTVKRAYHSYLLFCGTVLYNFLCLTLALSTGGDFIAWLFAGIYAISGIPGAFIIWYGRIYNAAAYDRSVTFMCYFLGSAIHISFCVWASIPVPTFFIGSGGGDSSFTGLIEVFQRFDDKTWLGVFYLIGFVLWVGNIVLSVYVWQQAMREFRGRGGPQQVQNQAQTAAGNVAMAAVTGRHV